MRELIKKTRETMAKDPAVLFYTSDFITGTTFFSMEERGLYITLLCMQHQQGGILEKDMINICGSRDSRVFAKFYKDVDGLYYNKRMKDETEKRKAYSESRANNRKKKENNTPKKPKTSKTYVSHMENENEDVNENINKDKSEVTTPKKSEPQITYPFQSEEFTEKWKHWKEYKKKEFQFKYKSAQSEQAALSELANLSDGYEDKAIAIIIQSMAKGWKGFFELKTENNGKGNSGKQSGADKHAEMQRNFAKADAMFGDRKHV